MRLSPSELSKTCADWGTLLLAISEHAGRYRTTTFLRFLTAYDCYEEANAILVTLPYESELLYLDKDSGEVLMNTKCGQCETEITGKWPMASICNVCGAQNQKNYEETINDAYRQAQDGY